MHAILLSLVAVLYASSPRPQGANQQPPSFAHLFQQLKSVDTTDYATSRFLEMGPTNAAAKKYLADRLPELIAEPPRSTNRRVWVNSVRLTGAFQITEAVPALVKWIYAATENAGGTLAELNRLDGFPCAKALVQIGDPAVPSLTEALEKGDPRRRWFAYRTLYLIGSPGAMSALRSHVKHETDADLKLEIEKALGSG